MSISSISPDGMTAERHLQLPPSRAQLAEARRFVTEWLTEQTADRRLIGDAELVASELVTNAFEHGEPAPVSLHVGRVGPVARLSVTSRGDADSLAPVDDWQVAGPDSVTGRGLGIVRSLAHSVDVSRRAGSVTVTVGFVLE